MRNKNKFMLADSIREGGEEGRWIRFLFYFILFRFISFHFISFQLKWRNVPILFFQKPSFRLLKQNGQTWRKFNSPWRSSSFLHRGVLDTIHLCVLLKLAHWCVCGRVCEIAFEVSVCERECESGREIECV